MPTFKYWPKKVNYIMIDYFFKSKETKVDLMVKWLY